MRLCAIGRDSARKPQTSPCQWLDRGQLQDTVGTAGSELIRSQAAMWRRVLGSQGAEGRAFVRVSPCVRRYNSFVMTCTAVGRSFAYFIGLEAMVIHKFYTAERT